MFACFLVLLAIVQNCAPRTIRVAGAHARPVLGGHTPGAAGKETAARKGGAPPHSCARRKEGCSLGETKSKVPRTHNGLLRHRESVLPEGTHSGVVKINANRSGSPNQDSDCARRCAKGALQVLPAPPAPPKDKAEGSVVFPGRQNKRKDLRRRPTVALSALFPRGAGGGGQNLDRQEEALGFARAAFSPPWKDLRLF